MATELQELLVKITPEGIRDTTDQLEEQGEQFVDTADTAGQETDRLERFSEKWQGAMLAIVSGLAVATAGLLSRVPVVQESMTLLDGIITALALKLDEELRPALNQFNKDLADVQQDVLEADGPWDALSKAVSGVDGAFDELAARNLSRLIEKFTGFKVDPQDIEIGINLLTFQFWDSWTELQEKYGGVSLTPETRDIMIGVFDAFASGFVDIVGSVLMFTAQVHTAMEVLGDLMVRAFKLAANQILSVIEQLANDFISGIPGPVKDALGISGGVSLGRFDVRSAESIRSAGRQRLQRRRARVRQATNEAQEQIDQLIAAMQQGDKKTVLELDARTVSRVTEPFFGTGVANQGRVFRGR